MDKINKKDLWERVREFLKSHDTLNERMFWCVVPLTMAAGAVSVVCTIMEGLGLMAVLSAIPCILLPAVMIGICLKDGKKINTCYKVFCLVLNCILMPLVFLANGGIESGMPMYCVGALMLCAFIPERKPRIGIFFTSLSATVICFTANIMAVGIAVPVREDFVMKDILLNMVLVSICLEIVIASVVEQVNEQRYEKVNAGIIDSLGAIIEFRSLETGEHTARIKEYTAIMLRNMHQVVPDISFTPEEIRMISSAAGLHDIGKIAVRDEILTKPGRLTEAEFEEIKRHPIEGCLIIETMRDYQNERYYDYCYEICRHHHERYDGKGYPDGLKGDGIPIISQIAAAADVYDALTSERVYKKAYSPGKALQMMKENEGQFSEDILKCLEISLPQMERIRERKADNVISLRHLEDEELSMVAGGVRDREDERAH